ncbi:MAG: TolC family protein, partial [Lysobacteraceae bacterium]
PAQGEAREQVGVATADLFPRFTLGALLGSQAGTGGALFGRDSESGFVALGIDWSFLDVGRVRARLRVADADAEAGLAQYERSVLVALRDTGDALLRLQQARIEDGHLQQAARDGDEAARLARVRYQAGASDLLEVLDAERTRLSAQDAFAAARTRSVASAIALHQALAGGWPARPPRRAALAGAP